MNVEQRQNMYIYIYIKRRINDQQRLKRPKMNCKSKTIKMQKKQRGEKKDENEIFINIYHLRNISRVAADTMAQ